MHYSGIGSRETPDEVLGIMEDAAYRLAAMGWVLRSGKATAVKLAKKQGIRTLNLLHEGNRVILEEFIKSMEVKRGIRS